MNVEGATNGRLRTTEACWGWGGLRWAKHALRRALYRCSFLEAHTGPASCPMLAQAALTTAPIKPPAEASSPGEGGMGQVHTFPPHASPHAGRATPRPPHLMLSHWQNVLPSAPAPSAAGLPHHEVEHAPSPSPLHVSSMVPEPPVSSMGHGPVSSMPSMCALQAPRNRELGQRLAPEEAQRVWKAPPMGWVHSPCGCTRECRTGRGMLWPPSVWRYKPTMEGPMQGPVQGPVQGVVAPSTCHGVWMLPPWNDACLSGGTVHILVAPCISWWHKGWHKGWHERWPWYKTWQGWHERWYKAWQGWYKGWHEGWQQWYEGCPP